jgi:predicted nucleotidyltransferase
MMDTNYIDQMRADYRQLLDQSLRKIVQQLSKMPSVEKVILFGSYVIGRRDLFTDLDLIVVMYSDQAYIERRRLPYRLFLSRLAF